MALVPQSLRNTLPPPAAHNSPDEPDVYAHYYVPDAAWHFYPSTGRTIGSDYVMFGLLLPSEDEREWGWRHVRESELERMIQAGHHVVLDEVFTPGPFTSVVPYPFPDDSDDCA